MVKVWSFLGCGFTNEIKLAGLMGSCFLQRLWSYPSPGAGSGVAAEGHGVTDPALTPYSLRGTHIQLPVTCFRAAFIQMAWLRFQDPST